MSKFLPSIEERIRAFRADSTKRGKLRKVLSDRDILECLDLVREYFRPKRRAQLPANDSMTTLMALDQAASSTAHDVIDVLFAFCDEPADSTPEPTGFPDLLDEGAKIPQTPGVPERRTRSKR